MNALARLAVRAPRVVVALWLGAAIACAPLAVLLPGSLKAGGFDNPRGDATIAQQVLQRAFHVAPNSLQVVLHSRGSDVTGEVPATAAALRTLPHVTSVSDYRSSPAWLSHDKRTTFLQVGFNTDETTTENLVTRTHGVATAAARGATVSVTGASALNYALNVQSQKDVERAELLAFPLLFLVLFLVFRSVAAMVVPAALAGMVIAVTSGIGWALAQVMDLSILFSNAVSMIGLAVAVDYSLFIIKRHREELGEGGNVPRSIERSVATAGHSVLFSGLAVVVALCALLIPRIMVFTSIALGGALVTAVALAATSTLLPAVLSLLGSNINWGSVRRRRRRPARTTSRLAALQQRPAAVLVVLLIAFGAMAWPISSIRLQVPVASSNILPAGTQARVGIQLLQDNLALSNLFPVEVLVTAPSGTTPAALAATVTRLAAEVRSGPDVASVQSVAELGLPPAGLAAAAQGHFGTLPAQAAAVFPALWATDGDHTVTRLEVVPTQGPDADSTHALVARLRSTLPAIAGTIGTVKVAGATAQGVDFDDTVKSSIVPILLTVAIATFALLTWAFASWLLPLTALAFNALVVGGSLGLLTLWFQDGRGQPINSVTPLLLFAVMFGLSMDYMVIMISRMRELYRAGNGHDEAVIDGLRRTAGLVNGAAVIMVAVFLSFGTAKITIVQQLGFGLAIAVVLDAVVVRLLVMPAALRLIGPSVWGRRERRPTGVTASAPLSGVS